jgi:hypothetical protein
MGESESACLVGQGGGLMGRGAAKKLPNDGTIERGIQTILERYEAHGVKVCEWDCFRLACTEHIIAVNPQLGWGKTNGRLRDTMERLVNRIAKEVKKHDSWRKAHMTVLRRGVVIDDDGTGRYEMLSHQVPALRFIGE